MFFVKKLLHGLILPPGLMIVLIVLGLVRLWRGQTGGRWLVALGVGLLWAGSTPIIANTYMRAVESQDVFSGPQGAQAIAVLGGGMRRNPPEYGGRDTVDRVNLERCRYAARIQRQTGLPLLTTGGVGKVGVPEGQAMAETLEEDFNVPVRWVEPQARDTTENAAYSARILKEAGVSKVILVTHASHMERSVKAFGRFGIESVPAPTGHTTDGEMDIFMFLPSYNALWRSSIASYEAWGSLAQRFLDLSQRVGGAVPDIPQQKPLPVR